jgi:hypothetical protein
MVRQRLIIDREKVPGVVHGRISPEQLADVKRLHH